MKKLISIVISIALLLTMFSAMAVTNASADADWHVIYDWENDEASHGAYVTSVDADFGDLKSITLQILSSYNNASYTLLAGSTKAGMFYNDKTFNPANDMSPLNNKQPGVIELPELTGATGLRANLHIKNIAATYQGKVGFWIGFVLNGTPYYYELTPAEWTTASWFEFVGKTYYALGTNEPYTLTAADVPYVTGIAGWVHTTGWHGILVDNIEYYGEEIQFPEKVDNGNYTVPENGNWNVMFDWENEGAQGSAITSTTVDKGANNAINVRDVATYQGANDYGMLEGSTKAIWVYNAKSETSALTNPQNGYAPATVALNDLTGASDLRIFMHIKNKAMSDTLKVQSYYVGFVYKGDKYFMQVNREDYFTGSYFSFVGKTFAKPASSKSLKVTVDDIPYITELCFWVQTDNYVAILIDNVEYYVGSETTDPYEDIAGETLAAAQLRIGSVNGIRFITEVDADLIAAAEAEGYTVAMGTLIAPLSYGTLTTATDPVINIATPGYYKEQAGKIAASIVNIKPQNISKDFVARGYVTLTKDETTTVYYATQPNEGRSLKTLSAAALTDEDLLPQLTPAQIAQITEWAND